MTHAAGAQKNGRPGSDVAGGATSAASLFNLLWDELAGVLGTAATAILLRRATQRALARNRQLAELIIERENLEYRYRLPSSWEDRAEEMPAALRDLIGQLRRLLVELTGPVILRHLEQIPELREQIAPPQKEELQ